MKKYYADKKSLNFLRVTVFIILIGLILGLKYLLYYIENKFPQLVLKPEISVPAIVIWSLMAALAIAYVVIIIIILPMWYNSLCYMVSNEEIIINAGIFMKNKQYMKISSVQYTTVLSMPLSKFTSFNFLVISAHGGRLMCMFLSQKDADEMAAKIQSALKSRGGL